MRIHWKAQGYIPPLQSRAAKRGCFKRGCFPIWTCPSFFVLFCPFWDFPDFSGIFPICSGTVRGFSRFALFLFLGLLRAPTRNSPERVRDTIWTFPEKGGKHPGLETPRFSFPQSKSHDAQFTLYELLFCVRIPVNQIQKAWRSRRRKSRSVPLPESAQTLAGVAF